MNELVNVYAKTEDEWKLLFKNIPEDIAVGIWRAGFKTGENRFPIENKKNKNKFIKNRKN